MKKFTKRPTVRWHPPNPILNFIFQNQIGLSLCILVPIFVLSYVFPNSDFRKLVYPPYQVGENQHIKGCWDVGYVLYYTAFWTFLRAFIIERCFIPLAQFLRCRSKLLQRFAEQAWLVLYYSVSFGCGFAMYYSSPYFLNTRHFWIGYPHLLLTPHLKAYYLMQISFWLQQLLVVNLEKPRKDHMQYVVHHVVTCTLLISSYLGNFTRIGSTVLTLMDVADIFLSAAKCLNYINWRTLCDSVFAVFVLVWIFTRHYLYFYLMYSVWNDMPILAPLRWDPSTGFYASVGVAWFFLILFSVLQALLIYWFAMILNVVMKVLRGTGVEDNRSDDEFTEEETPLSETNNMPSSPLSKDEKSLDLKLQNAEKVDSIHSISTSVSSSQLKQRKNA